MGYIFYPPDMRVQDTDTEGQTTNECRYTLTRSPPWNSEIYILRRTSTVEPSLRDRACQSQAVHISEEPGILFIIKLAWGNSLFFIYFVWWMLRIVRTNPKTHAMPTTTWSSRPLVEGQPINYLPKPRLKKKNTLPSLNGEIF